MLTLEVRDQGNRKLAQFAIFPLPAAVALPEEQVQTFEYLASSSGERFFFLVSSDVIHGWRFGVDVPQQPSFKRGTTETLGLYAEHPGAVASAKENQLASLVQAWLADLLTHWKSQSRPAPGEDLLHHIGFVQQLRGGNPAT